MRRAVLLLTLFLFNITGIFGELVSLQGPGNWPKPFSVTDTEFKRKPAQKVCVEMKVDELVFIDWENVDITPSGAFLSRSKSVDVGSIREGGEAFASSHTGNPSHGHVENLNSGKSIWVPKPDHEKKAPVYFGIKLRDYFNVNKIGIHQRPYGGGFREIKLTFSEGEPVIIELPYDEEEGKPSWQWRGKMYYFVFPPHRTKSVKVEVLSYYPPGVRDGNGPGIFRFEIYEAKSEEELKKADEGYLETCDISPYRLGGWLKFEPEQEAREGKVFWEYSVDSGETWEKISEDGDLGHGSIAKKKIRFRVKTSGYINKSPVVKGFKFSWIFLPDKAIAEPLDPKTCRLSVKDGTFVDQKGNRVSLCGIWDSGNYLGVREGRRPNFEEIEKQVINRAHFGLNVIRLGIAGTLILPDAKDAFPDTEKYKEVMKKYKFDAEWIEGIDKLIETFGKYGIYTILEFHDNPPFGHWSPINKGKEEGLPEKEHYKRAVEICADEGKLYEMWSWVAKHYKGNPCILGFEIPWNEPLIGGSERTEEWDKKYYEICKKCAETIKKEDPDKIVIVGPNIWNGPGECRLSSSLWRFPEKADAIHFHLYPRSTTDNMRRWYQHIRYVLYITAQEKPLIVTEGHPMYILWDKVDLEKGNIRRGIDCMLSQWYGLGVQTIAWWGPHNIMGFTDNASRFHTWTDFWKKHPPKTLKESQIAIVVARTEFPPHVFFRMEFTDKLYELHALPHVVLFDDCVLEKPEWLKRYKAIVVYKDGLSKEAIDKVKESGVGYLEIGGQDMGISEFLEKQNIFVNTKNPDNLLIAYGKDGFVVHEWKGKGGVYKIYPHLNGEGRIEIRDYGNEKIVANGEAREIYEKGITVKIEPYRAKLYEILEGK